jgi:hypothetical protein
VNAPASWIDTRLGSQRRLRGTRSLLVGLDSFTFLKEAQQRLPAPRMDMRYLVEGALEVVAQPPCEADWLQAAERALREQLGHMYFLRGTGGGPAHAVEGAPARTRDTGSDERAYDPTCRSLLVGDDAFAALKLTQKRTHSPRLDMRYLIEGALALIRERACLQPSWVHAARKVLRTHLAALEAQPIEPFHLEIQA